MNQSKSEIRQNYLTGNWSIFAPQRSTRPNDHKNKTSAKSDCPFCTGNEDMLPYLIYEVKDKKKWSVRVVPNKYPALSKEYRNQLFNYGFYSFMKCAGYQEVIIETPHHNVNLALLTENEILQVINTYQTRYKEIINDRRIKYLLIFRNQGIKSGATRIHPHSQIMAMGFIPTYIKELEERAKKHFMITKNNLFLEMLDFELKDKKRILLTNKSFTAFAPYASECPYEIWIMPKKQNANFTKITIKQKKDLAKILKKTLFKLYKLLNNPDYNMIVYTPSKDNINSKFLQWYIQIRPRFSLSAGFEQATHMHINSIFPEDAIKELKII